MDQAALYEEDIYAWSQHQAAVLRRMAANPAALPNDLALELVAEEIEEVGNEQRFGVESNSIQAFIHLIKLVALPEDQAARHWIREMRAFLFNAARRYRPSMRRDFDHEKLWSDACRLAVEEGPQGRWPRGAAAPVGVPLRARKTGGRRGGPAELGRAARHGRRGAG